MPSREGSTIGSYELGPLLGEGGMGEVYRARDSRLGREVALKVLPDAFVQDEERLARFEREARLLASLNHPNVASIYGLEESDGVRALVMELVEGRTLAEHLSEGPLRVRDALAVGRQVAEALAAAHARGVVHRDLKPSNIKLETDGTVKVLDFGLAKLAVVDPEHGEAEPASKRFATRTGSFLGTPPYMSPEQLEGRPADPRTDIWSFGCLLYEMLAGRTPFGGTTVWQSVAAVLQQEPDLERLPTDTPARVRLLIERCLRKEPARRLHHIADARIEIEEALEETAGPHRAGAPARINRYGPVSVGFAAAGVALATTLLWTSWGGSGGTGATADSRPVRFSVPLPAGVTIGPGEVSTYLAVSPDGRRLAFVGTASGGSLRVHDFGDGTTRALAGTAGAATPFWSPDSRFIGFFADAQLKRVGLDGSPPQVISDAVWEAGNAWSKDDVILFAQPIREEGIAIHRVSASGGTPTQVTRVDTEREIGHFWPSFLPDGRHFLYLALEISPGARVPTRTLYVASLDGGEPKALRSGVSRAVYAPPGVLLYVTEGVLVAHPFDEERLGLFGEPQAVADQLRFFYMTGQAEFSASQSAANPVVAFHGGSWTSELVLYDRTGERLRTLTAPAAFDQVRIAPSGDQVVVDLLDPTNGGRDLWIYELASGRERRLTLHRADEQDPVWSPDGSEILFRSDEFGPPDLFVRSAAGGGEARVVLNRPTVLTPEDWSADGRHILYQVNARATGADQWLLDLQGESEPRPLLETTYAEWGGRFSPDGRWVAFVSNESGVSQVYVAPVEDPGARRALSTEGGVAPRWRSDGREVFYLGPGSAVMAVELTTEPFRADGPRRLFTLDGPTYQSSYDVTPDGRTFLVSQVLEDRNAAPIQVILNWPAAHAPQ